MSISVHNPPFPNSENFMLINLVLLSWNTILWLPFLIIKDYSHWNAMLQMWAENSSELIKPEHKAGISQSTKWRSIFIVKFSIGDRVVKLYLILHTVYIERYVLWKINNCCVTSAYIMWSDTVCFLYSANMIGGHIHMYVYSTLLPSHLPICSMYIHLWRCSCFNKLVSYDLWYRY